MKREERNYSIKRNTSPIPVRPGEFNDGWDIEHEYIGDFGWEKGGVHISNGLYEFLKAHFRVVLAREKNLEKSDFSDWVNDTIDFKELSDEKLKEKYAEAIEWRDWATCDLISDELADRNRLLESFNKCCDAIKKNNEVT